MASSSIKPFLTKHQAKIQSGRSMLECMEILSIATQKGINVYAVKGDWQLTNSIQSKIIAMAFSMASETERDLISKRTREALLVKKQNGMKLGRPRGVGKSKLEIYRVEIEALIKNGSTQKFIANRYHTTEANLHHWLKQRGLERTTAWRFSLPLLYLCGIIPYFLL